MLQSHLAGKTLAFLLFSLCSSLIYGQTATLKGDLKDEFGKPVPYATVAVMDLPGGSVSGDKGEYALTVPANRELTIVFSHVSYESRDTILTFLEGETRTIDIALNTRTFKPVIIESEIDRGGTITALDPRVTKFIPSVMGGVETLLAGQSGVSMRNELSSAYSVRGGNYDENLVYVNDIEVYRPFLVRSGEQEGLSFPNADMISSIYFSAGGFDAKYGDKMSSTMDIHYRRPTEFAGSFSASLLGGSVHLESVSKNKRFTQITGVRYRSSAYILGSLDTQGDYKPAFADIQSYLTYALNDKWELGLLGVYSSNKFNFIPENRETEFGNINEALKLTVYFEGQEVTRYQTVFGAISATNRPKPNLKLLYTFSGFKTVESETFDILGQYFIDELDRDLGSDEFGEVLQNRGIGSFLGHARNDLEATVFTFAHRGSKENENKYLQWGARVQAESIQDQISEWILIDSAGYSIPQSTPDLELSYTLKSELDLSSIRLMGYLQNTWTWHGKDKSDWTATAGLRANYWNYNEQTVVSPRATIAWQPNKVKILNDSTSIPRDVLYRFSTGYYYQPPFYKELRRPDGTLNPEIQAQRAIHFVLGMDRNFFLWDRPFKWVAEVYYKDLGELIPYKINNVQIRYLGENNSKGYAYGLDLRLNGEFINGVESWVSIGIMSTQEDILDDFYYEYYNDSGELIIPGYSDDDVATDSVRVEPGYIPRPTDQRLSFAMFFQDEMPNAPSWKVHLMMIYGTGLPFGPPGGQKYQDVLRTPAYRRVDIGFSKQFIGAPGQKTKGKFWGGIKDMYLSLEIFNLLNINNTVSYLWVQDVNGRYYAVPNFLTSRRVNIKLVTRF